MPPPGLSTSSRRSEVLVPLRKSIPTSSKPCRSTCGSINSTTFFATGFSCSTITGRFPDGSPARAKSKKPNCSRERAANQQKSGQQPTRAWYHSRPSPIKAANRALTLEQLRSEQGRLVSQCGAQNLYFLLKPYQGFRL